MTNLKGRSPAQSRIYDNSNKLDSQLTIIGNLLETNGAERQEIIHAVNIAWDINNQISIDISEDINGSGTEQFNNLQASHSVDKEDIKPDFSEIDSMMAGMQYLTVSGFSPGDLENLLGVARTLMSSLEKKVDQLLAG
ncbi:hypothetical protein [Yersinia rohdei]|uniref:hypothetical protein n=1 Tax=Yersinia rohdei TaxID=29485 RepID=UPI0011A72315|nr:hypothetical protein [Yersinia rohdei]